MFSPADCPNKDFSQNNGIMVNKKAYVTHHIKDLPLEKIMTDKNEKFQRDYELMERLYRKYARDGIEYYRAGSKEYALRSKKLCG